MIDAIKSALKSLWANRLRSFLTLLGIVIGIYTVVTLLSVAQGLQKQIADQVEGLGPRTMIILPGESGGDSSTPNFAAQLAPSTLKTSDIAIVKSANLVESNSVEYAVILGGILHNADKKVSVLPIGATLGVADTLGYKKISSGRAMSQSDINQHAAVVFLNQSAATKLGVGVGATVTLGKDSLVVKGIYEDSQNAGLSPGDTSNAAIMPVTFAQDVSGTDQVNRIIAKAKTVDEVDKAKVQVTKLLSTAHGSEDFTVLLSSDLLKSVTSITDILKYAVVGIAAISLLVAGIGISNIMLVTVTERTREIGIRKAVGATESAILLQFLIESIVLTTIGAALGLGLATLTTLAAAHFSPLEPSITLGTVLLSLGMGVLTGIIFGFFPAFRAARKNPVEALRYE